MASSTSQRTGSCLCGAVEFKISGDAMFTCLCHCYACQKSSGSVFASTAVYKAEVEFILASPDAMKTRVDGSSESGNEIERSFCGMCGSPVKNVGKRSPGTFAVPTGLIDGDKSDLKPQMELFCANREEWLGTTEGAKIFSAMPSIPSE